MHEFARERFVSLKQFGATHCVACCHWTVCNSCLIKTGRRCSLCGVLLLRKLYTVRVFRSAYMSIRTVLLYEVDGGPRVVVSTAAFHARVRGSVPGLGGFKETKMFLPHPRVKVSIVGSLRDREVACSASDRQGSNFESCVWRTVSSQSSHHPQEVLLAQFSLYVHKSGLKPDSFHFLFHFFMRLSIIGTLSCVYRLVFIVTT